LLERFPLSGGKKNSFTLLDGTNETLIERKCHEKKGEEEKTG